MKVLERVPEERMVAAFLKAEIDSPRWQAPILARLSLDKQPRSIVDCPDLGNVSENEYRALLLSFRGYGQNTLIFSSFPDDAQWQSALLDTADLENVRVMNRSPWPEFSGGIRIASDVAKNFKSGRTNPPGGA